MNDSSTGGPIRQLDATPANDGALADVLQKLIVGITGIPGNLVRPRWQRPTSEPNTQPTQPAPDVDWCSIGVIGQTTHDYPYEQHVGSGDGESIQITWETLDCLASFYGPNCQSNASSFRAGLYISQNREMLIPYGIKLKEATTTTIIPDSINVQWISRCDVAITFNRQITRRYPIRNLESVQGSISVDTPPLLTDRISVTNPVPV